MVTITQYARQQKRHRCIEQSFGLCGRGRGWDDLGEWNWNMYNIICETNRQSRFDAWYWMLGAGALGWPRGMRWEGGERGFRMGNKCTPVVDSYQCMAKPIQYCKVISLQLKKKCFLFFKMYCLCEKHDKPITVHYYITNCVSWVPRLTLLDL